MSFDYLVDHALKNVWCTPNQDMQSRTQPARLTPKTGVWNNTMVLWRKLKLPEQSVRFHVYQIGQLHPNLMGLFQSDNVWTTLADTCNKQKMIVDIYANSGVQMPRSQCWYMVTADKNLILAVKEQASIPINLREEDIFLRVYSNAYFHSIQSDPLNDFVEVGGKTVSNTNDILAIQQRVTQLQALPGAVYAFVNGMKTAGIDLINTKVDDVIEYVYDSSIAQVIDFAVKDLPTFVSTLDDKHKYLLHYPGSGDSTIDYHDDIDVFVVKPGNNGRHVGVYYHRNQEDSVRMLTHKDYAIVVPYLVGYAASRPDWTDPELLYVRLHIRKSGYVRPLVDETHRIKELYKLPDDKIVQAMVGLNSTVEAWTASGLEDSMYSMIMRSDLTSVTRQMVQDAYGYNAVSKLMGDTPKICKTIDGSPGVDVPHGMFRDAMAYEYDANGKLLAYNAHDLGSVYFPYDATCTLVEMIPGFGDQAIDEYYGTKTMMLDPMAEYRMYVCPIVNGFPSNKWQDVTGSGMYALINGHLTWLVDPAVYYTLVRSNINMLAYDLRLLSTDGLLKFSLDSIQSRASGSAMYVMQIPMGELDLWLNGYSLIENVDYFVNFPEIAIVNKSYLRNVETDQQLITIRFTGFCNADLTREPPKDVGFVKYGQLSHNNRFDIRDDKVMRIVVGGKTSHRSTLKFSEDSAAILVPDASNGTPYMLRDMVVPLRGVAVDDTYVLRAKSKIVDDAVSAYLTVMKPEVQPDSANVISQLYELVSPFCCKLIYDLKSGVLDDVRLYRDYTDQDVIAICKPYETLLKFDPTQDALRLDEHYVAVHPHNLSTVIDVTLYQYKFLTRAVRLYLKDRVDLSHFVRLSA